MTSFKVGVLIFLSIVLNGIDLVPAKAECLSSKVLGSDEHYRSCEVIFRVLDEGTHKAFEVKKQHDKKLLKESSCESFCQKYRNELQSIDASYSAVEKGKPLKENAALVTEYGVSDGKVDSTEALGAFDDLEGFGFSVKGNRNLDVGGGQFNSNSAYLRVFGVENRVFDPWGRTESHNAEVLKERNYDTVTSISVLNVILDENEISKHIQLAYDHIKKTGVVFFKVYEGNKSGIKSRFQRNQKTAAYLESIAKVFGAENVEMVTSHNLIVARKK